MDFLKTLLIYMSVLFVMGVENAELPDPASMPTPTPAPKAETTADPGEVPPPVAVVTPVPEVTAVPVPTMTPNARYSKLQMGDKGNNVKKLQQRLIALGYMKKGTDDGVYGYQTLNAVRAFQKANGLAVDGVAGKATLTHIYEDKSVIAAPSATPKATKVPVTPTPVPGSNATPEPEDAQMAGWYKTGASVLLNGNALVMLFREGNVVSERSPAVYLHDGEVVISLSELVKASGVWQLEDEKQAGCTLTAAGYVVRVVPSADGFFVMKDGAPVQLSEQSVLYTELGWMVKADFIEKALGGEVNWDQEENTLVLRVAEKSQAESDD